MDEVHKILYAIGANEEEKAEFDAYKLKDVIPIWYKIWVVGRAPTRRSSHQLGHFQDCVVGEVFSTKHRESNVEKFINLCHGGMLFKEYSLKIVKLFNYASSLVSSSKDEMRSFVTSVLEDLKEEFREAMLHNNMYIARLKVH